MSHKTVGTKAAKSLSASAQERGWCDYGSFNQLDATDVLDSSGTENLCIRS